MGEQLRPETIQSPEKSAIQLWQEYERTHDEATELMDQVHALEIKAAGEGLSKEEFESIVEQRDVLNAQCVEKWEAAKKLEGEVTKAFDEEADKAEAAWEEEKKKLKAAYEEMDEESR